MTEVLPPELWAEILVRLPVRTLLTLKCVSKSVLYLIESTTFANLHFSRFNTSYSHSNHPHHLLLVQRLSLTEIGIFRGNSSVKALEFTAYANRGCDDFVGYAQGWFWLHRFYVPGEHSVGYICNPSRRHFFSVPSSPTLKVDHYHKTGFGYDPLSDDYKAVAIGYDGNQEYLSYPAVFSLKRGSWRSLEVNAISSDWDLGVGRTKHVYANGAIHWLSRDVVNNRPWYLDDRPQSTHVVLFDTGAEVFRIRELHPDGKEPKNYDNPHERTVKLPMTYRGLFAVCYIYEVRISVWVMTEEGWAKELTVDSSGELFRYLARVCYDKHVHFHYAILSESTDELLIVTAAEEGVISYNLKTQQHKTSHKGVSYVGMCVDYLRLLHSDCDHCRKG